MKAPYSSDGSLLSYAATELRWLGDGRGYEHRGPEWREAEEFTAQLSLVDMERGRSAARFVWEDDDGRRYPMFMVDMLDAVSNCVIIHGRTHPAIWRVVKRGQNFGIRLVEVP